MDRLVHGIAADATIRVMAAITTETVREAVRRHQTSPTTTCALGRALTGTLLLGASLKDFDRLTLKIDGDGPLEGLMTEAVIGGKVRGYVKNPAAEVERKPGGELNVPGIIGKGMIHVIREAGFDIGLRKEPYIGSVEIGSGEVAEDLANYLLKSEQIPSAVLLGEKLMKEEPFVLCSGGVMVQMLPGFDENHAVMIEDSVLHAPSISQVIAEGATPEELLSMTLGLIDYQILGETPVSFECGCSLERAKGLIASLGTDEIRAMIVEDKGAAMTCGFCNERYDFSEGDLVEMLP
jgi:molecular chaperone Hsp33